LWDLDSSSVATRSVAKCVWPEHLCGSLWIMNGARSGGTGSPSIKVDLS
jgi:hypothetical protein